MSNGISKYKYLYMVFMSNKLSVVGALIVIIFLMVGIFGPLFVPYSPEEMDYNNTLSAPSSAHIFGTDEFGRDLMCRVIYGARVSITIALIVILLSRVIGIILGIISGYAGGIIDTIIMRFVDLFMAFPPVVIAMVMATIMGGGMKTLIIALSISMWTGVARLARGETLSIKQNNYILATKAIGGGKMHTMWHHILPNIFPPILISSTLSFGRVVLSTAGLSFIGIGIQPPIPEWGLIISNGRQFIVSGEWWLVFFPGLAIMITVMGLNLLGDGLRDIFDPKERKL
jgi:peptide/nickel transport system permease protein